MPLGRHAPMYDRLSDTRWRVYCSCGWVATATGTVTTTGSNALAMHNTHLSTVGFDTRNYAGV